MSVVLDRFVVSLNLHSNVVTLCVASTFVHLFNFFRFASASSKPPMAGVKTSIAVHARITKNTVITLLIFVIETC